MDRSACKVSNRELPARFPIESIDTAWQGQRKKEELIFWLELARGKQVYG